MATKAKPPIELLLHLHERLCGNSSEAEDDTFATRNHDAGGLYGLKRAAIDRAMEAYRELANQAIRYNCYAELRPSESDPFLDHLRRERDLALSEAEDLSMEIAKLDRLGNPDFMGEAYDLLEAEFAGRRAWQKFITAALEAEKNYQEYRQLGRTAQHLSSEISATAKHLARLVRDLRDTGLLLPKILSGKTRDDPIDFWGSKEKRDLKIRRFALSFVESRKSTAPPDHVDLRDFLLKVSEATDTFTTDFMDPAIHSALSTRQNSRKTSYLRAFGTLLRRQRICITPAVKRAMAITANTIMNDAELDVSEDDVRKALGRMAATQTKKRPRTMKAGRSRKTHLKPST